jgi:Mn2+/Fe2+ NRAMP family transporter
MGNLVNRRLTSWAAYLVASLIIVLNVYLLMQSFGVSLKA